jgi:hypothetical protein
MAKSAFAENMDLVQTQVTGFLRPLGFRKRGRTYTRRTADGLVQVINLQMAQAPIGTVYEYPPIRVNLYGQFTVNLGVWVPEVSEYHLVGPKKDNVQEYHCQIRARLGYLDSLAEDTWWPLDERWASSASQILQRLQERGLPFLEGFASRDQIVANWVSLCDNHPVDSAARVVVAIIEAVRGRRSAAQELLEEQYRRSEHKGHREYLEKLADRLRLANIAGPAA